jgi:2-polyprenyl-6-hydroxyphenyl methylase/3-demethylubiquinone-9 3-methyltransferase
LDVGCGGGFSCEFLAARGAKVFGIDRSQNCINTAKAHAGSSGWEIDYQQGYAEDLPYPDDYFDAVVCVDVLEHVTNWQQTVTEIHITDNTSIMHIGKAEKKRNREKLLNTSPAIA